MWTGSIWYYRDPLDAPSVQKALTGVDCDSGVMDGKFIGNRNKDVRKYFLYRFGAVIKTVPKTLANVIFFQILDASRMR